MANEWYYTKGDQQIGPVSASDLKAAVASGDLTPTSQVWKEGMAEWKPATKIKGLFDGLPGPTKPIPESSPPSSETAAIADKATKPSAMSSLLSTAKSAAQLAAKQAEKTKLTTITLPAQYQPLGKHCYESQQHRSEFADLFQKLDAVRSQLAAIVTTSEGKSTPQSLGEKAKATAGKAIQAAQSQKLSMQQSSLFGALGKAVYEAHGESSGTPNLTAPIAASLSRLADLDADISRLSSEGKGSWITPKRLAIAGAVAACFLIVAVIGKSGRNTNRPNVVTEATSDSTTASPSSDAATRSEPTRTGLPGEFLKQKKWPAHPLAGMPEQVASAKNPKRDTPFVFFSPRGVYALFTHAGSHDLRLWNVSTGKEATASSPDCDYFSFPAALSPDETTIACLDGELLRFWSLSSSPASLVQSIPLKGIAPNDLLWTNPSTVLAIQRQDRSSKYLVLRKSGSQPFSPVGTPQGGNNYDKIAKGSDEYTLSDLIASPDGRFLVKAAKSASRKAKNTVFVEECETHQPVAALALPSEPELYFGNAAAEFPSSPWQPRLPDGSSKNVQPSSFLFSPHSQALAFSYNVEGKSKGGKVISLWRTDSWKETITITPDSFENSGPIKSFTLQCFSSDDALVAGTVVSSTRTSRGEVTRRSAVIWDTVSGKRLQTFELADPSPKEGAAKKEDGIRFVAFTADARSLVIADSHRWVIAQPFRTESVWSLTSWDVATGEVRFKLTGKDDLMSPASVSLSPDGSIFTSVHNQPTEMMTLWDVPHLVKLVTDVKQGDEFWTAGDKAKAFPHYCAVLVDSEASFVKDDLPRLWSRCIDYYAANGNEESGRQIIAHALSGKIALDPESPGGKKTLERYIAERNTAARQQAKEQHDAEVARVAALRAKNRQGQVPSRTLTKQEFVEKLQATMTKGRLDNLLVYAQFDDYSFQDAFGDPDSNTEWQNSHRLLSYRCKDGSVQLTVLFASPSTVVVSGINLY
ncbi:MAG: GYF domain-containing protein [Pirellulales bacterium]